MWKWTYFKEKEIACRGIACACNHELWNKAKYGEDIPEYLIQAMDKLQALREAWDMPIILSSAHRCVKHNMAVGGASASQHLDIAFDCVCPVNYQAEFVRTARKVGFTGIGYYASFIHIDLGKQREWVG